MPGMPGVIRNAWGLRQNNTTSHGFDIFAKPGAVSPPLESIKTSVSLPIFSPFL